jgi:hypothetical protein
MITIFNTYIGATELLFALVESTTHTGLFCHSCKFVPVKHTLSSKFYDFLTSIPVYSIHLIANVALRTGSK